MFHVKKKTRAKIGPTHRGGNNNGGNKHKQLRICQKKGVPRDFILWLRMRKGMNFPSISCCDIGKEPCFKALNYWRAIHSFVTEFSAKAEGLPTLEQFKEGLFVNEETFHRWGVCWSIQPDMIWALFEEGYRKVAREHDRRQGRVYNGRQEYLSCYYGCSQYPKGLTRRW